jgi:hypothetical protein
LILSSEPMSAALLGILLERDAYEPVFARPGETPEAALQRVRPLFVILLDERLDVARSDLFYTRAERSGVRVILWGAFVRSAETEALARSRGVASFTLPIAPSELAEILARPGVSMDRRGAGSERRAPAMTQAVDRVVFTDRYGRRWQVYDRRGGERRHSSADAPSSSGEAEYRVFVNEAGEEWRYRLAAGEDGDLTPQTLERQLAEALKL